MFNKSMADLSANDAIMGLNALGARLALELGRENVFNFSLGNPSVEPPEAVRRAIEEVQAEEDQIAVHGYSANAGMPEVRSKIAESINRRFGQDLKADNIYVVPGSCAGLSMLIKALAEPGDEFIVIAPYFTEYKAYVDAAGATLVSVPAEAKTFHLDNAAIREAVTAHTKAVIIDSPNNPSGAIYPEDNLRGLAEVLKEKETAYGHPIYLISDEPYREIVYDSRELPYLMDLYDDTVVSYSFSKSLSLAGDRIGYLAFCSRMEGWRELFSATAGAGRVYGHACAPTLFQKVVAKCLDVRPDVSSYRRNRDTLVKELRSIGYELVEPEGAFYIMLKSLIPDSEAFSRTAAEEFRLLMVPTDAFGYPGYVRISYCVSPEMIERSLPSFRELFDRYN